MYSVRDISITQMQIPIRTFATVSDILGNKIRHVITRYRTTVLSLPYYFALLTTSFF